MSERLIPLLLCCVMLTLTACGGGAPEAAGTVDLPQTATSDAFADGALTINVPAGWQTEPAATGIAFASSAEAAAVTDDTAPAPGQLRGTVTLFLAEEIFTLGIEAGASPEEVLDLVVRRSDRSDAVNIDIDRRRSFQADDRPAILATGTTVSNLTTSGVLYVVVRLADDTGYAFLSATTAPDATDEFEGILQAVAASLRYPVTAEGGA